MISSSPKTGYLESDFKIFHITDQPKTVFTPHYHDFHKIFIFLRGNVSYMVEGKQYELKPDDIVLIQAGELHRPIVHDRSVYERIILYLSPAFFSGIKKRGWDLFRCFGLPGQRHSSLARISVSQNPRLVPLLGDLAAAAVSREYAAPLYQEIKILEFLIFLNRTLLQDPLGYIPPVTANPAILQVMEYIHQNLTRDDLNTDQIAESVFLNRSYVMHLFKAETGYTIGSYITEKRLFLARGYLAEGLSVTEAGSRCGFKNYAAFYYAYRQKYGCAPTERPGLLPDTQAGPDWE